MRWLRIAAFFQISLIAAMFALRHDPVAAGAAAAAFVAVVLVTWTRLSFTRLMYSPWLWSFLVAVAYFIVPAAAVAYYVFGWAEAALLMAAACAGHAERFRERCTGETQLGWWTLPAASVAIAVWVQSGDARLAFSVAAMLFAAAASLITNARLALPAEPFAPPVIVPAAQPKAKKARSVGQAA